MNFKYALNFFELQSWNLHAVGCRWIVNLEFYGYERVHLCLAVIIRAATFVGSVMKGKCN